MPYIYGCLYVSLLWEKTDAADLTGSKREDGHNGC